MAADRARRLVKAAGAVVVRGGGEDLEVLVIHRPRYDDWSHPKGKCERGEKYRDACIREVEEETGLLVDLEDELQSIEYVDGRGRPKRVRYWLARPAGSGDIVRDPDDEVDEVRWIAPPKARKLLSNKSDRRLLDQALEVLA